MKDYYLVFIKAHLAEMLQKLYSDIKLFEKEGIKYLCVKRISTESPFLNTHIYVDPEKNQVVKTLNIFLPLDDIMFIQYVTDPTYTGRMGFH
jgi:hypothetical protein